MVTTRRTQKSKRLIALCNDVLVTWLGGYYVEK